MNWRAVPLPKGYKLLQTEQWEWTLWTADGDCITAASEATLRIYACGIEAGKQIIRDSDDWDHWCYDCHEMTCSWKCTCRSCHPGRSSSSD